jgi:hypothetical protein
MVDVQDRLLADLMREHGQELESPQPQIQGSKRRSRRAPLAAAFAVLVSGVLATTVLLSGGPSASSASAVTLNPDGSVTVSLGEVLETDQANRQLAALGVRARIAKVEPGCTETGELIPPNSYSHQQQDDMVESNDAGHGLSSLVWTIHPEAIPAGDTVLIRAELYEGARLPAVGSGISLYRGQAPACKSPGKFYPG